MRARAAGALLLATVLGAGCGSGGGPDGEEGMTGTLTVLAASSLTDAFTELGHRFEEEHAGLTVAFNLAASSSLNRQLAAGAPGDVLATADEVTMGQAVDEGTVGSPTVFARNRLAIVTRRGNPDGIAGLADLARPGLVVVLCAPEVPCGRSAAEVLNRAGVEVAAASEEENVTAVLSKVVLGEADAGIVYVTDVKGAGDRVAGVTIPDVQNVVADYPMAVAVDAAHPLAAQAWVDFVLGSTGQAVLARHGFAPPGP